MATTEKSIALLIFKFWSPKIVCLQTEKTIESVKK